MDLAIKGLVGATIVVVIQLFARTENAYIAGLIPLFPTMSLIAMYLVGTQRGTVELRETIRFGMWSLIPYFCYLAALYLLVDRAKLIVSLAIAVLCWLIAAGILVLLWNRT